MISANTKREEKKISELAREYRKNGFQVTVLPRGDAVPQFLRGLGFEPDLIAQSQRESWVIEVSSRDTAQRLRELSTVVSTIESQNGWHFELVMTNPRRPTSVTALSKIKPSPFELRNSLEDVKSLLEHSRMANDRYSNAVLLTAWALVEGALRRLLTSKVPEYSTRMPRSVARDGVILGFLSPDDGTFLETISQARSMVAHGGAADTITSAELSRLVRIGEDLLAGDHLHSAT